MSNLKSNNYPQNDYYQYQDDNNQQVEVTQIIVDNDFDGKIKRLNREIDIAKDDIKRLRQLGTQLKTNVSTFKIQEIKKNMDRLNISISSRLRDVGTQILTLGSETKNRPKDKTTKIRISLQRKLANELKQTMEQYNRVKSENQKEAYSMFRHQYMITHGNASEAEIQESFEENNGAPVFIQELAGSQQAKMAYQESENINAEMKRIEQSIEELLYTFQDMQNMLVTQNDVMVTIEENVDQADDAVQKGSSEMVKAIELRKSSRKKLWIITGIIAVILLIIGIYLYNTICNNGILDICPKKES
jgi:t-SNARE complex subunit (syntaxin)